MFKLFKGNRPAQPQGSLNRNFENWRQQKNSTAERLLRDFPWLWAIKNYHSWDDGKHTQVKQDMTDLKMVLTQPSQKSRFLVWTITSQEGGAFNIKATCLSRSDDTWAEVIVKNTIYSSEILYIVTVDPLWGESHPTRNITIFRRPEKKTLNEIVEQVCQLHSGNTIWLIPSGDRHNP